MIVARVVNGPYRMIVVGDSYEDIIAKAEEYVYKETGKHFTPTYYMDLSVCFPEGGGVVSEWTQIIEGRRGHAVTRGH